MNIERARQLSLPDILARLGHQAVKTAKEGRELWYLSPFRNERSASFHTSIGRAGFWIWKDFGDTGGDIIDFAARYWNTDKKGALKRLGEVMGNSYQQTLFFNATEAEITPKATTPPGATETLVLKKVCPLTVDSHNGKILLQYLTEKRGIDPMLALRYLLEVRYHNNHNGKDYFAVGIKNESGGYETRNPYHKSVLGTKDITLIKGKNNTNVSVFEGFIDFLSALTYYQSVNLNTFQELVQSDTLIMNSVSFYEQTNFFLKVNNYTKIFLYLDNDKAGQKVRDQIQEQYPLYTEDRSNIYRDCNDFNEFLIADQVSRKN